ncbi:hypothetical protein [Kitasatospora azatica]|uniref:hypothetical protein n=1 Tax=Kitasatospora azatica TaxID=58347 RepID=UPI00055C6098|nr:hypothetical protein [Kitasatospora azatica]
MAHGRLRTAELTSDRKLPWTVRLRLRWVRQHGGTGLLMHASIREPVRSLSLKSPVVTAWEGRKDLCSVSCEGHLPRFVALDPGTHRLTFQVARLRGGSTSFERIVELLPGQVFLALCDPVQADVFYRRSLAEDSWTLGTV